MPAIKTHIYLQNNKLQGPNTINTLTQEQKIFILSPSTSIASISCASALHICIPSQDTIRLDIYDFNLLKCIFFKHFPFHFDDTDSFLLPKETIK